jgi:hypothetical protein
MQNAAKKTIAPEQWNSKLAEVKVAKEDMNKLVMNFLVTEVRAALLWAPTCTADPCTTCLSRASQCAAAIAAC